jgi:hypothetical protein
MLAVALALGLFGGAGWAAAAEPDPGAVGAISGLVAGGDGGAAGGSECAAAAGGERPGRLGADWLAGEASGAVDPVDGTSAEFRRG